MSKNSDYKKTDQLNICAAGVFASVLLSPTLLQTRGAVKVRAHVYVAMHAHAYFYAKNYEKHALVS